MEEKDWARKALTILKDVIQKPNVKVSPYSKWLYNACLEILYEKV